MPELPEMQALAERLHERYAGALVESLTALSITGLKTVTPAPESLTGARVAAVTRRGKYLVFDLQRARVLVHLSQGGRVDLEDPPRTSRSKQAVARFTFGERPSILVKEFGTERKAGWWILEPGEDGPLENLGPEPDSQPFAELILHGNDRRRVHTMLRDQRSVAGIGRGYADEILHRARLSPTAVLDALPAETRGRLLDAVREVLGEALVAERTRTGGLPAKLAGRSGVHARYGHPCPRCGEDLRRISYASHEITYCPRCQTGGKVLADRRMSRLVR